MDIIARYIQSGANQILSEKDLLVRVLDFDTDEADSILKEAEERIAELDDEDEFDDGIDNVDGQRQRGDNSRGEGEGEDDTQRS